jgi:hypothetical protein
MDRFGLGHALSAGIKFGHLRRDKVPGPRGIYRPITIANVKHSGAGVLQQDVAIQGNRIHDLSFFIGHGHAQCLLGRERSDNSWDYESSTPGCADAADWIDFVKWPAQLCCC